jgi:hypothetical protein
MRNNSKEKQNFKITTKIKFIIALFLMLSLSSCQSDTIKTSAFSDSTEIERMFNEILEIVQFGLTTQEEIEQKLCGRQIGLLNVGYPENSEISFISRIRKPGVENLYKTECPGANYKWEDLAYAMNSVEVVFDDNQTVQFVLFNPYGSGYDWEIENIINIFGKPTLFYHIDDFEEDYVSYFAYPEKGFAINMWVSDMDPVGSKKWQISSEDFAWQMYLFEPMKLQDFKSEFVGESIILVDDWEIVQTNYFD